MLQKSIIAHFILFEWTTNCCIKGLQLSLVWGRNVNMILPCFLTNSIILNKHILTHRITKLTLSTRISLTTLASSRDAVLIYLFRKITANTICNHLFFLLFSKDSLDVVVELANKFLVASFKNNFLISRIFRTNVRNAIFCFMVR